MNNSSILTSKKMDPKLLRRMDQNNNHTSSTKRIDRSDIIRRKRKPMMEKRRRARINASLEQLKKLVLDATRRDSARYSKLEKADILELTVKHIKDVQRVGAMHQDPSMIAKFQDGFGECVAEVNRCLNSFEGVTPELHSRLMGHLSSCLQRRSPLPVPGFPSLAGFPSLPMIPQQELPFHPLSPGIPGSTPLQSLPGAFDTRNPSAAQSTSLQDVRAFQNALMQVHSSSDIQERARTMERLLNTANGNASLARHLSRLNNMKQEPLIKIEMSQESMYLRERMMALEKGENVWRPW